MVVNRNKQLATPPSFWPQATKQPDLNSLRESVRASPASIAVARGPGPSALPPLMEVVRGSLVEHRLRCGKPTCHWARGDGHRVWYLTVTAARGRTEPVTVPAVPVPVVHGGLQSYARWWTGRGRAPRSTGS